MCAGQKQATSEQPSKRSDDPMELFWRVRTGGCTAVGRIVWMGVNWVGVNSLAKLSAKLLAKLLRIAAAQGVVRKSEGRFHGDGKTERP